MNNYTNISISLILLGIVISVYSVYVLGPKSAILGFIIGSSLLLSIFSYTYIGAANLKFKGIKDYEYIGPTISYFYGLFNILNIALQKHFGLHPGFSFLFGGLQGVVMSIYGRFFLGNLPVVNFGFNENNIGLVHLYAFIYYGLIHLIPGNLLNSYLHIV